MLAVATAVYGRVADLAGIRLPLLVGVGLMTGGAVLGAFAPSFEVLLGARLLQGLGAAAVPTLGMAIVSARYEGTVRTAALGRVAGMAAAVSALGPLAGGLVADLAGWRAVVALPALGLLVVPALWRAVPSQGTGARLDVLGAVLVAGTAAGLVLLVQSPAVGHRRRHRGRRPARPGRPRRRGPGPAPAGGVPADGGHPRAGRRAQRAGGLRRARRPGSPCSSPSPRCSPRRAGRRCRSAWRWCRAPSPASSRRGWPGRCWPGSARPGRWSPPGSPPPSRSRVAALGAAVGSAPVLVTAVVLVTFAFGLGQPALMAAVGGAVPADVRGVALGIATLVFLVGGGVGSAVVGGIGEVLGLDRSLLLLAVLPLAGCLALVGTIRAERVALLTGPGIPGARRPG